MISKQKKALIIQLVCGLLIFLFFYTATSKLMNYHIFQITLAQSPLIAAYAGVLSILVPVIEYGISILLLMPHTQKMGLYSALFLLLIFASYIALLVVTAPSLPYSCGGAIGGLSLKQHLLLNLLLAGLTATAIFLKKERPVAAGSTLPVT